MPAAPVLQFKRGQAANIASALLRAGEPGFTTDRKDFYIGLDGTSAQQQFFGSARYWRRENGTNSLRVNFVDKDGTSGISIKSPDTVSIGTTDTYTLPNTDTIQSGYFLQVDSDGMLSWANVTGSGSTFTGATLTGITTISGTSLVVSAGATFTGVTTFIGEDNTLGVTDSGILRVQGGVGISSNLTVGAGLSVGGQSFFEGTATFYGGTINLGDENTDVINVGGRFSSDLIPNVDNSYDVGISTLNWRNAYFSGIGTFESGAVIDAIQVGVADSTTITTTVGELTIDSAQNVVNIASHLSVTGVTTFSNATDNTLGDANSGAVQIDGGLGVNGNVTVGAGLSVNGNVTLGNDGSDEVLIPGNLTVSGTLTATVAGTISTSQTISITDTDSTTGRILFSPTTGVGNTVYSDDDVTFDSSSNILTITGTVDATTVETGTINASDGTAAITINTVTGNVGIKSDLTVDGNLYVNGSVTQVNTQTLAVEDRFIEAGISTNPPSDSTWDVGVLFNYYRSSSNKKAGIYWDDATGRIGIATDVGNITGNTGIGSDEPTVAPGDTGFAPIEIASLWVRNTCQNTSVEVIGCYDSGSGSELQLRNIVIDAGEFV